MHLAHAAEAAILVVLCSTRSSVWSGREMQYETLGAGLRAWYA